MLLIDVVTFTLDTVPDDGSALVAMNLLNNPGARTAASDGYIVDRDYGPNYV